MIKRNEYAKFKYEEEQKRKREAEQRARIETEKANYRQIIGDSLLSYFNQYLSSKVSELQGIFSNLTYENFDREVIESQFFRPIIPNLILISLVRILRLTILVKKQKRRFAERF